MVRGRGAPVLLLHGNGGIGEEILAPFACRPGVMWLAPDRPGYGFSAARPGGADPGSQARWAVRLLDALRLPRVTVVAHSIAAGMALCLASRFPHRVASLTLINPFCRPTPHAWAPALRLAVAPVVGAFVRPVVPSVLSLARGRLVSRLAAPNPPTMSLRRLPIRHMARPRSILTLADELKAFNAGIEREDPRVPPAVPVTALFGAEDGTADPGWHGPWLADRAFDPDLRIVPGTGHMLHHVRPDLAWLAVRDALGHVRSVSASEGEGTGEEEPRAILVDAPLPRDG
jgi:pimeloyl-ACP methyl ester carboxylesterase